MTQAAVGAGHWASGRRQRALAAWACAAGSGLVTWGLGTEAPTRAEMVKNTQQHRDLLRKLGTRLPPEAPATAGTQTHLSQRSQNALSALACAQMVLGVVFGVRSGLRHPRQLTVHAIASETFNTVTYVLRATRAVQRRRPRIAAGRALSAAGSLARLRAHRLNPSGNSRPAPATATGEHRETAKAAACCRTLFEPPLLATGIPAPFRIPRSYARSKPTSRSELYEFSLASSPVAR